MERWLPAQSLRSKPQWLLKRRGDAECVGVRWVWNCAQVEHKWHLNKWPVRGWLGVWECPPHTHEALSLNPRHSCKNLGTAICAWKLSTVEGGDKRIVGCQPTSTFSERSCLSGVQQRVIVEDTPCLPLSSGYTGMYPTTCTHRPACSHTHHYHTYKCWRLNRLNF